MSDGEGEYHRYGSGDTTDNSNYSAYSNNDDYHYKIRGRRDDQNYADSDDDDNYEKDRSRGKHCRCYRKCRCKSRCKCKYRCKCRPKRCNKPCGKPKYCKRNYWPPAPPEKKGSDQCFGDIEANNITADSVKGAPQKVYIPGRNYGTLATALRAARSTEEGGPIGGYHYILRHGTHELDEDYSLPITQAIFEAQSWTPTMANAYFVGHGHSMRTISNHIDFYDKQVGGLGPYCIEICGKRITVISKTGCYNPCFNSLRCGDKIYWRYSNGRIRCFNICKARCNWIQLDCCIGICKAKLGDGFWVANRSSIRFRGQRTLMLSPGGNLQYRGLNLSACDDYGMLGDNEDSGEDKFTPQMITGTSNGTTNLMHCHVTNNMLQYGGASWLTPNIVNGQLRLPAGSTGTILYTGWINSRASVLLDQALVALAACLLMGNRVGVESWGSAGANLIGSTVHGCETGARVVGGTFNCPGTSFSSCETGILARSAGKVISSVSEFRGLAPLTLVSCILGFDFDNKVAAESDTVVTTGNTNDLTLDGTTYTKLSDYITGTLGAKVSTYAYLNNE